MDRNIDVLTERAAKEQKEDPRIRLYGRDILNTPEFRRMYLQTHHHRTSVGKHSVLTARMGLWLCDLLKHRGIRADEKKVVRIALLHDVGMLDRYTRYRNNFECGKLHPVNSAAAAKRLWSDIDDDSLAAIRSHMWPLSVTMPHTREGVILCIADKMAAIRDVVQWKGRQSNDS